MDQPIKQDYAKNMLLAQQIALSLTQREVDANEAHKALQFLVAYPSGPGFFTFLQTVQRNGSIVARSNRTLSYYATLHQVCLQHLSVYQDDAKRMANILGWAIRLMPFYRLDPHLPQPTSNMPSTNADVAPTQRSPITQQVTRLADLHIGMELIGRVVRLTQFGAFIDIGIVGQDGLVHVSKLREGFVHKPEDVVQVGDTVTAWVDQIDREKKRIGLTMIDPALPQQKTPASTSSSTATTLQNSILSSLEPEKAIKSVPTPRPAAIQVSTLEQIIPGIWLKGIIRKVDINRLIVDIGIPIEASIAFAQLEGQPKDPDEVAAILPAGMEIEARVLGINQRGRLQLTLKP